MDIVVIQTTQLLGWTSTGQVTALGILRICLLVSVCIEEIYYQQSQLKNLDRGIGGLGGEAGLTWPHLLSFVCLG